MSDIEIPDPPKPGAEPRQVAGRVGKSSLAELLVGSTLDGRYELVECIGEGGMGWVFRARHTDIGKPIAVKVLPPSMSRVADNVTRFRREARAASAIGSPHIVQVSDFGTTSQGAVYMVMEYVEGEDLTHMVMREGPLPWERAGPMFLQICDTLAAAHDEGIVHRDVKPANFRVMQDDDGRDFVKVLDFGIARLIGDTDALVTKTGTIMGTPGFMPPEQAIGEHVDARADVYGLAATAYWVVTGRAPFSAKANYEILKKQLEHPPPPPSGVRPESNIPEHVDAALLRALRPDPQTRFQSIRELADALTGRGASATQGNPKLGGWLVAMVALALLVAAVGAWAVTR